MRIYEGKYGDIRYFNVILKIQKVCPALPGSSSAPVPRALPEKFSSVFGTGGFGLQARLPAAPSDPPPRASGAFLAPFPRIRSARALVQIPLFEPEKFLSVFGTGGFEPPISWSQTRCPSRWAMSRM